MTYVRNRTADRAERVGDGVPDDGLSGRVGSLEERIAWLDREAASLRRVASEIAEATKREAGGLPGKVRELTDRNLELEKKAEALILGIKGLEEENERLSASLRAAELGARQARDSLARLRSSWSWWLTAPLRRIRRIRR